jgi:hypothetical protein
MTQLGKQWAEFESQVQSWLRDETARALWGDEPVNSEKGHQHEYPKAVPLEKKPDEVSGAEEWHARSRPTPHDRPLALLDAFGDVITDTFMQLTRPHLPFQAHPYSPAALEADAHLNHIPWRAAFEDLIRIQHGAPQLPSASPSPAQPKATSHPQWPHPFDPQPSNPTTADTTSYSTYPHDHSDQPDEPPAQDDAAPSTELDLYERLAPPSPPNSSSSVLSSLTTTERTTAPDGTVTTRTVLRKRFADGREESSESVHTEHREADAAGEGGRKKGGWFWSG